MNVIRPDFIRVHATGIKPESKMGEFVREGSFTLQSEEVNPRMNKVMKILMIVVALIIAFILIFQSEKQQEFLNLLDP